MVKKNALIIGVTGQDGAYLSRFILGRNYSVFGITRSLRNGSMRNLQFLGIEKQIQLIEFANVDLKKAMLILSENEIDEVYNLSAQSSVGYSFVNPLGTVEFNVMSVLIWLEAITKVNKNIKFYQASSSEMFGNVRPDQLPLSENNIFRPASPYGVSKATGHWMTVVYRESYELFACCGVLFNHESCLRGENFVIKKVINSAVKIKMGLCKSPIKVGNISIKRDWGYAPLYVEAMWQILQQKLPSDFLICTGESTSLQVFIEKVLIKLGLDYDEIIQLDKNLWRPVDLEVVYGDNSKALRELDWKCELSLDQLIDQLILDEINLINWELSRKL
jgi:GDPmannose 4,6-dehydratase